MTGPRTGQGVSHLGGVLEYQLDQACIGVARAFGTCPYLVGSAMEKGDWRDVDVRVMLDDAEFDRLFPGPVARADPLWSLLCLTISEHLSRVTGLPVDFQIQRTTDANAKYPYRRHPLTLTFRPDAGERAAKPQRESARLHTYKPTTTGLCLTCGRSRDVGAHRPAQPADPPSVEAGPDQDEHMCTPCIRIEHSTEAQAALRLRGSRLHCASNCPDLKADR